MTTTGMQPNRQLIEEHLTALHHFAKGLNGLLVLVGFGEDPVTGHKLVPLVEHFTIGDVEAMTRCALTWTTKRHTNVYAPLAVMRPDLAPGKKGDESAIVRVLGLVADFDDDDATRWGTRVPIMPTAILETSPQRFQTIFFFSIPLDRAGEGIRQASSCPYPM